MADSHYTKANSAVDRARTYAERGGFPDTANAFATIALAEALLNISEKLTVREGTEPYCPLCGSSTPYNE